MAKRTKGMLAGFALVSATCALACGRERPDESGARATENALSSSAAASPRTSLVPWGNGDDALGLQQAATESLAQGVTAIGVLADGTAIALDRQKSRVVRLDLEGRRAVKLADVPRDADDLATDEAGAFVVLGALTGKASLFDASRGLKAEPVGSVDVPRVFQDIDGLALAPSHRVIVRTSFQETFTVGSPAAPLPVDVAIRTRREGAVSLGDKLGVQGRALGRGKLEIVVVDTQAEHAPVLSRFAIDGDAVQIVGAAGGVVCARVEHLGTSVGPIQVTREAVCIDATTGATKLRAALPAPGLYVPRRELAMGGRPLTLVHARPEEAGVFVTTWTIGGAK
jgi:hypothetical protein